MCVHILDIYLICIYLHTHRVSAFLKYNLNYNLKLNCKIDQLEWIYVLHNI